MGLSELCIRRPVLTTLVTATFIVFGVFAYRLLPVAALPAVDFPTISVSATLPGVSLGNLSDHKTMIDHSPSAPSTTATADELCTLTAVDLARVDDQHHCLPGL